MIFQIFSTALSGCFRTVSLAALWCEDICLAMLRLSPLTSVLPVLPLLPLLPVLYALLDIVL